MKRAKQNDAEVHSEVEDSKYFRFGKCKHQNATISECNAGQNLPRDESIHWEFRYSLIMQLTEVPIFSKLSFALRRRVGDEQMA